MARSKNLKQRCVLGWYFEWHQVDVCPASGSQSWCTAHFGTRLFDEDVAVRWLVAMRMVLEAVQGY